MTRARLAAAALAFAAAVSGCEEPAAHTTPAVASASLRAQTTAPTAPATTGTTTGASATISSAAGELALALRRGRPTAERVLSRARDLAIETNAKAVLGSLRVERMTVEGLVDVAEDRAAVAIFETTDESAPAAMAIWLRTTECTTEAPCLKVQPLSKRYYLVHGEPKPPPLCPLSAAWAAVITSGVPRGVRARAFYGDAAGAPDAWRFEIEGDAKLNRNVHAGDCRILTDREFWSRPKLKGLPPPPAL